MASKIEYFKDQPPHEKDGAAHWLVLTDQDDGVLKLKSVKTTEVDTSLEGTEFLHLVGLIPRFEMPRKKPRAESEKDENKS